MNETRATGAVALAAGFARLAVVAWAGRTFPPAHDGVRYDAMAARLAEGHGYTWQWPDGAVTALAHYPVGYPALLAATYRAFGHSVVVAGLLNVLLGTLAAIAVHRMVLSIAPPRVALVAGLAVAFHPGLVMYTPGIMTEGLTASLLAVAAWVAVAFRGRRSSWTLVLLGAVLGLAGLVRPQSLLLVPLFGMLCAGRRGVAACAVVAALVCAPWIARNCGAVGRCTISTNAGWNLLIGAQETATGAWQSVVVPPACEGVFGESATDDCFGHAAVAAIERAPLRSIGLVPRKLGATFDYGGIGGYYLFLSNPGAFPWRAVIAAGAIETLFERLAIGLCLLGVARAEGPRRRLRLGFVLVGVLFSVLPMGWVAVVALCVATALLGIRWLADHPVHTATLFTLATTSAVHAVFFGAPRYALVAAPLVTAVAVVSWAEWRARSGRSTPRT